MLTESDAGFVEGVEKLDAALRLLGVVSDEDPETRRTALRVARLYGRIFSGLNPERAPELSVTETDGGGSMVLIKDLPFYSMCAHHLVPFFGKAHIAYVPDGKVVGFGSFSKVLDFFSHRPQLQERLAQQVADYLDNALSSKGLIVFLEARQMCMEMHETHKPGVVEYAASRGVFDKGSIRDEFFRRITVGNLATHGA
jgi:GTP cyclohydrolase I